MRRGILGLLAVAVIAGCTSGGNSARPTPPATPAVAESETYVDLQGNQAALLAWERTGERVDGAFSFSCPGCYKIPSKGVETRQFTGRIFEDGEGEITLDRKLFGHRELDVRLARAGLRVELQVRRMCCYRFQFEPGGTTAQFERRVQLANGPGGYAGHVQRRKIRKLLARVSRHRVDVDGDGRTDDVVLRWLRVRDPELGQGRVRIRVRTARGATATAQAWVRSWYSGDDGLGDLPWIGAADIDGRRGRELVIGVDHGAHSVTSRILRWSEDRLRRLPPPDFGRWFVNSSVGTGTQGYRCWDGGIIRFTDAPSRGRALVRRVVHRWAWTGSDWALVGTKRTEVPEGSGGGWWDCDGVPPSL